jgi:hypothetical protein
MNRPRKCPKCQTRTCIQVSEGFAGKDWYIDYKCTTCGYFKAVKCNTCAPDPLWVTEFSVASTIYTPIGIEL